MPEQPIGVTPPSDDPDVHLAHLLTPESIEEPWFMTFGQNIKELFHPTPLPPLEGITSKPIEVGDMWGLYGGQEKTAGTTSLIIHAVVIALVLFIASEVMQRLSNTSRCSSPI